MPDNVEKLDCHARVITPENIEFEYSIAGPFQRLPAFLFDVVIRIVIYVAFLIIGAILFSWLPFGTPVFVIGLTLGFFLMSWFYGVFFETRFNGRTLGKMVFKLRTISIDGRPINASQAALRNMLRLADMCFLLPIQIFGSELPPIGIFPTFVVGLLCMMLTSRMQRIGDLAAGTMVVMEQGSRFPWNLKPEDLRAFGLAELIPANFQASASLAKTIGLYMENRQRLSILRRNDVARHLAEPLLEKLGLMRDTSPDLLLCALYVRTFLSEEQREEGRQQMRAQQSAPPSTLRTGFPVGQSLPAQSQVQQGIPVVQATTAPNPPPQATQASQAANTQTPSQDRQLPG